MNKLSGLVIVAIFTFGSAATAQAAPPKGTVGAYVWLGDAAARNPISAQYSYNSVNKANTVKRTGNGTYEVKLEGIGTSGGQAQVTAYGSGSVLCKPVRWNQAGADQIVQVACFKGETPTDSQFSLLFVM
jgi:hypothetical protein